MKQYQRLFEMEDVDLTFQDEALSLVARKAIERKTGARGLRSILESILLDTMYDLPGLESVEQVVIGPEVVEGKARPLFIYGDRNKEAPRQRQRVSARRAACVERGRLRPGALRREHLESACDPAATSALSAAAARSFEVRSALPAAKSSSSSDPRGPVGPWLSARSIAGAPTPGVPERKSP